MKTHMLTLAILLSSTSLAVAQDAPTPEMPQDMRELERPAKKTTARRKQGAQYLRFTHKDTGVTRCGEIVRMADGVLDIDILGARKRYALSDLRNQHVATSCAEARRAEYERWKAKQTDYVPPLRQPKITTRNDTQDAVLMILGGTLASGAGAVGGIHLAGALTRGCGGFLCGLGEAIVLGGLGAIIAPMATVSLIGGSQGREGNVGAAGLGAVLGLAAGGGLATLASHNMGDHSILLVPVGVGIGATLGYLVTDTSDTQISVLPTNGGAYASYGFSF